MSKCHVWEGTQGPHTVNRRLAGVLLGKPTCPLLRLNYNVPSTSPPSWLSCRSKVPSILPPSRWTVPLSRPQRWGVKHAETAGSDAGHAQRSVETRQGRLPSAQRCFLSHAFPAAVSGLVSDTERLAHPPTCSTGAGQAPFLPRGVLCSGQVPAPTADHTAWTSSRGCFWQGQAHSFLFS